MRSLILNGEKSESRHLDSYNKKRTAVVPAGSAAARGSFGNFRIDWRAAADLRHSRAPSQQFAKLFRRQPGGLGDATAHGDGVDGIVAPDHKADFDAVRNGSVAFAGNG